MALPQLNHKNVVRYFGSWLESADPTEEAQIQRRFERIQCRMQKLRKQKNCHKGSDLEESSVDLLNSSLDDDQLLSPLDEDSSMLLDSSDINCSQSEIEEGDLLTMCD
jgi:hypothetical protein